MRITEVTGIVYRQPIIHRAAVERHAKVQRRWHDTVLVRVDTDAGFVGWGEAFGHFGVAATTLAALDSLVAPHCIGMDPLADESLTERLERRLHPLGASGPVVFALSGLDIALWDLRGKAAGVPVSALLGASASSALPAYASMIRYESPQAIIAEVCESSERGYAGAKLHEVGLEEIRAGAQASASVAAPLMLDVNCAWTLPDALTMADSLTELSLHWLEEPVWPPGDHDTLVSLRQRVPIPLAAGENALSIMEFEQMLDRHAVDHAQPSVTKIGGISAMRRLCAKAASCGVAIAPHSPYFGPGLLATLHVCAALAPTAWIEHLFYDLQPGPFGDWVVPRAGRFVVPQAPGLGVEPDLDALHGCRIHV